MSRELIAAATAADSATIPVSEPTTFVAHGTWNAENIDVMISGDDGATFTDLYQDGTQVQLNTTNNAVTAYGPGLYKIDKPTTTNAMSVHASRAADMS